VMTKGQGFGLGFARYGLGRGVTVHEAMVNRREPTYAANGHGMGEPRTPRSIPSPGVPDSSPALNPQRQRRYACEREGRGSKKARHRCGSCVVLGDEGCGVMSGTYKNSQNNACAENALFLLGEGRKYFVKLRGATR